MGDANRYRPGAPAGSPERGQPPAGALPFLLERNNEGYAALKRDDPQGLVFLGLDRDSNTVFVFAQEEGSAPFKIDDVRNFLAGLGVDDAVALDSGGASMLVEDSTVVVEPDFWREKSMPMAIWGCPVSVDSLCQVVA